MTDEASSQTTDEEAVVQAAVDAAEDVIFSAYPRSAIRDVDVTVHFDGETLEVDIYLHVPDDPDADQVADDAALAARQAVDELVEGA